MLAVGLAACDRQHPAENAGRSIDQTADQASNDMDRASTKLDKEGDKAGAALDDTAITAKVKSAILAEPGLKVLQISVDTSHGIVTLSGSVDSQQSSQRAEQVASSVSGVKSVDNKLTVKSNG